MNVLILVQFMLFDVVDVFICGWLSIIPFRDRGISKWRAGTIAAFLYAFVVATRLIIWSGYATDQVVSLIRLVVYLGLYWLVVRSELPKLLFVLLVALNYFSFIMIALNYISSRMFPLNYLGNPYSFYVTMLMAGLLAVSLPPMYWLMNGKIRLVIRSGENRKMWSYIWLVPAIFCLIFHYNVLQGGGIIEFSRFGSRVMYSVMVSMGSLLVTFLIVKLVEESNSNLFLKNENYQLALQRLQFENLKIHMEEIRRARHDLRHNMALIQSFLDSRKYEEMAEYIGEYFSTMPSDTPILYCDNYAMNAVIVFYEEIAAENQIPITVDIQCPQPLEIQETDAAVLMGNLLENAVEACCKIAETAPFIRLLIRQEGGAIIIALDNSYNGEIYEEEGGFSSTKETRMGVGISSVRRIVEKYNGVAKFEYSDKVFAVSIMLNP